MRPFLAAMLALCVSGLTPAVAQKGPEANLVLTILGGTVTGHDLWTIDKQPLCVGATICTGQYDTVRLSRSINSSLVLGAAGTYFLSPSLGIHAEVSYIGLPLESSCTGLFYNPDVENKNQQICDDIDAQAGGGGAIAIFTGATARAYSRRSFSPYLRGSIGLVSQQHSTIEVVGGYTDASGVFHERQVISDASTSRTSLLFGVAAGVTTPLSPGYQFRFELRDLVTSLKRLTGPANALGDGPTATRFYHHFALTLGFDVVLEKKRGRRY